MADERQACPAPRALRRRRREERRERQRADDVACLPHRVARREQDEVYARVEGVLVAAVVAEPERAVRELERAGAHIFHTDASAGESPTPRRLSSGRSASFEVLRGELDGRRRAREHDAGRLGHEPRRRPRAAVRKARHEAHRARAPAVLGPEAERVRRAAQAGFPHVMRRAQLLEGEAAAEEGRRLGTARREEEPRDEWR
mmetsp:Transcript_22465/g.58448  ORF Transcript_22465/g.58448 Transcript_22465/m.58448 type:complete len:201 (+) Transcript_22465:2466-3068(+)